MNEECIGYHDNFLAFFVTNELAFQLFMCVRQLVAKVYKYAFARLK